MERNSRTHTTAQTLEKLVLDKSAETLDEGFIAEVSRYLDHVTDTPENGGGWYLVVNEERKKEWARDTGKTREQVNACLQVLWSEGALWPVCASDDGRTLFCRVAEDRGLFRFPDFG